MNQCKKHLNEMSAELVETKDKLAASAGEDQNQEVGTNLLQQDNSKHWTAVFTTLKVSVKATNMYRKISKLSQPYESTGD